MVLFTCSYAAGVHTTLGYKAVVPHVTNDITLAMNHPVVTSPLM
jgi:hypothetical protein